jgi:sulfopyruvate decarboxylase TPP-binding subunit
MLDTKAFGEELKKLGFSFYSGVPCSFLNNLINYAINKCKYVAAANEGDAVAIASGVWLTGRKSVVLMQNSGLTNAVSPLVSLNYPFQIPVLGFVSLRGEPGAHDEPQHELMGANHHANAGSHASEMAVFTGRSKKGKTTTVAGRSMDCKEPPFLFCRKKRNVY